MFPVGLYYCFSNLSDARIFIIMYGVTSMYFSAVMVRLMLVLAPVMCILSGIGVSQVLSTYMKNLDISRPDKKSKKQQDSTYPIKNEVASGMILVMAFFLITYTFHSTWVTSEAYSSPSIVLSARGGDGSRIIFDDFREAYYWLRHNTPEDAKVMSWWDYGYQITAMANRTILVDNNTWNNTHISRVGQAMASTEEKAYEIMRELDVSYVLVIFGGLTGYSSDDINKFLWMVRIGGAQIQANILRRMTIILQLGSSVWTVKVLQCCSTASCTRCVTTALDRFTQKQSVLQALTVSEMLRLGIKTLSLMSWRKRIPQNIGWSGYTR